MLKLNSEDLKILAQLSACPGAVFGYKATSTQQAGNYILYVIFPSENALAAIDYEGSIPRIVPKNVVEKLARLKILKRIDAPFACHGKSVLDHVYTLNVEKLVTFEQTKEIGVQIALGVWFKHTDEKCGSGPG